MTAVIIIMGALFLIAIIGNIGDNGCGPFGGPPDEEY